MMTTGRFLAALAFCLGGTFSKSIEITSNTGGATKYKYFTAYNETRTCSSDNEIIDFNIHGVALGGWMVLEPWITPSLFYQFLGKDETSTAIDHYSFCEVLGPEEGNKQLRRHWDTWVTKDIIKKLKDSDTVDSLRLPVADWMYKPYGPYVGCTDGALDYVDKLLDWAHDYDLNVLIDIHAVKGSQNGLDNSGQTDGFKWTSKRSDDASNAATFEHWPIRSAGWMGTFHMQNASYTDIDYDNIQHTLDVVDIIAEKYKDHPAVLGLEPVNEPWYHTPIGELKKYYWEGYLIVKKKAPKWMYIMHDAFHFNPGTWGGFMDGCPDKAIDSHIYQAWNPPSSSATFYTDACSHKNAILEMEKAFGPVIIGEWSLATDNCAMWLNGFNDNSPGYPKLPCKFIECAEPYMGTDQPGTPINPAKGIQGPFGTGTSTPIFGMCPVGRDWHKESKEISSKEWIRVSPEAPIGQDATDEIMTNLALKKIETWSRSGHGSYFWNFRTELHEPDWSYILALEKGWIPKADSETNKTTNACFKEENGGYMCVAKRDQDESKIRFWIKNTVADGKRCGDLFVDTPTSMNMTGEDLYLAADCAYTHFWEDHRKGGAACDLDGTAILVEANKPDFEENHDAESNHDAENSRDAENSQENREKIQVELKMIMLEISVLLGFLVIAVAVALRAYFSPSLEMAPLKNLGTESESISDYGSSNDSVKYIEIPETAP